MKPGVSVIICCYNSAKRLPETLQHLALQEVPDHISWEIIVVNNASTDDTAQVAKEEWAKYSLPTPFKIVDQPEPGLSKAREKGFEIAKYNYCLFCDDDNWLQKDYVSIAFETMESDPMIGAVGGQGEPVVSNKELLPWVLSNKVSYAIGPQHNISGDITLIKGKIYGAGAVFCKSSYFDLKRSGFVSLLSDRKGKQLSSGGDTELCLAFVLKGYNIFYSENLKFKHYIPEERISAKYVYRMKKEKEHSRIAISLYQYKIFKPEIFNDKFLWWKELGYSLKMGIKNMGKESEVYHLRYCARLLKDRKKFSETKEFINRVFKDYNARTS